MKKERKVQAIELLKKSFPDIDAMQLKSYIASRNVKVDGETIVDPSQKVSPTSIALLDFPRYVSRGGFKLEHALDAFAIDVTDLICLDAGSSTGGFTDCLLQHGAKAVHSVDVGYNQLDYRLRMDERVIVHERTNILHLEQLDPPCHLAVADLSFRSIRGVATRILSLTSMNKLIFLVKPQFEVDPETEGFNGIITDDELLRSTMDEVYTTLTEENVGIHGLLLSPITGRKGNREFLALLSEEKGMERNRYREVLDTMLTPLI